MKKKHGRGPQGPPVSAPVSRPTAPPLASLARGAAPRIFLILGLSAVLGLAYNSSSPLGVRFAEPAPADAKQENKAPMDTGEIREVASNVVSPPLPVSSRSPATSVLPSPDAASPQRTAQVNPRDPVPMPPVPPANATTPRGVIPTNLQPRPENEATAPNQGPVPVRWVEVKPLLGQESFVLVDARLRAAHDAAHIPGSISLPYNSGPAELTAFQEQFPQTTKVIVYCGGRSCNLSRQLAFKLFHQLGYADVAYMPGGLVEWQQMEAVR